VVCLASVGAVCFVAAVLLLITQPRWETPILSLPLGVWLLGGAGGLATITTSPGRARRLRTRTPARLGALTVYRLLSACLLGGIGYAVVSAASAASGMAFPGWLPGVAAVACGVLELVLNDQVLQSLAAARRQEPRAPL